MSFLPLLELNEIFNLNNSSSSIKPSNTFNQRCTLLQYKLFEIFKTRFSTFPIRAFLQFNMIFSTFLNLSILIYQTELSDIVNPKLFYDVNLNFYKFSIWAHWNFQFQLFRHFNQYFSTFPIRDFRHLYNRVYWSLWTEILDYFYQSFSIFSIQVSLQVSLWKFWLFEQSSMTLLIY